MRIIIYVLGLIGIFGFSIFMYAVGLELVKYITKGDE